VKLVEEAEFGEPVVFKGVVPPWVQVAPAVPEWLFIGVITVKFVLKKEPVPFRAGELLLAKGAPPAPVKQWVGDRLPVQVEQDILSDNAFYPAYPF
jgi:hypothetical protein